MRPGFSSKEFVMKSLFQSALVAGLGFFVSGSVLAGYPVYPAASMSYFEDSENAAKVANCLMLPEPQRSQQECARLYFIPRGIRLARERNGVPMLHQRLKFDRNYAWNSTVTYNLTLEPDFGNVDEIARRAVKSLAARYQIPEASVRFEPIQTKRVQFLVRQANLPRDGGGTIASFTETVVPTWKGSFQNLSLRFSITLHGPMLDLEPGMMDSFLNEAGNGAVGQVSFAFPVQANAIELVMACNAQSFGEQARELLKKVRNVRLSATGTSDQDVTPEERNLVRNALDPERFCIVHEYSDTTLPQYEAVRARKEQLFTQLFEKVFSPLEAEAEIDSGSTAGKALLIALRETTVFDLTTDLDFYAGGVTRDNLSPDHRYICAAFKRYDPTRRECVQVCDPLSEVYLPKHQRADRKGCVDHTVEPIRK
jgi:hypothetical protein